MDFEVGLKVLSKKCFGSAGCSLTVRIAPVYVGKTPMPTDKVIDVTYEIRGRARGVQINTFSIEEGTMYYEDEEALRTETSRSPLSVEVTDVFIR
jgi:hypothetical protein